MSRLCSTLASRLIPALLLAVLPLHPPTKADEPLSPKWTYAPELLRPFWLGGTVEGESVLFIRDPQSGVARASVLIAGMVGNRDWIRLKHERFAEYRDALLKLRGPGIAVADVTSIWTEFLERKRDWDLTGNGVNHPNDFGHRVYAQMLAAALDPKGER